MAIFVSKKEADIRAKKNFEIKMCAAQYFI